MLKPKKIDFASELLYVRYGRMSGDSQNPRSPDQQFDTIEMVKNRQRRPWILEEEFRDDAISGLYVWKRPAFNKMVQGLTSGRLKAKLILVDTLERFGRSEEVSSIRRTLCTKYGVLVLTADTDFGDPTTPSGSLMAAFEGVRATEDGRIKAHNVLRGKRDTARMKHWPGGPIPFGYKLESVLVDGPGGRLEVDHSVLVPDPVTRWIPRLAFARARETGHGPNRVTQWMNRQVEIPDEYKPFAAETIRYWFLNPIYRGVLRWEQTATGIVDDVRVVEANAEEEVLYVPDFCEPIVEPELSLAVEAMARARSERNLAARARTAEAKAEALAAGEPLSDKPIEPLTRGLSLKYLLSGLVRCGSCGRSMRAQSSGRTSKSGRTYTYYTCPGTFSGACDHKARVSEQWLRESVISAVRAHLFPGFSVVSASDPGTAPPAWLLQLSQEIEHELRRDEGDEHGRRAALASEAERLARSLQGWMQSLANQDLAPALRTDLEEQYAAAKSRLAEIKAALAALDATGPERRRLLDPAVALGCLNRLAEVLANGNPTEGNLELSRHIDSIIAYADGRVVLRTSRLGIFEGASALLARGTGQPPANGSPKVKPRRRARLQVESSSSGILGSWDEAATLDPARFAGLDESWFWVDNLTRAGHSCWSKDHAADVGRVRLANPNWTVQQMCDHFGVSSPTLRKALRYAAELGAVPEGTDRPGHVRPSWPADHAAEVKRVQLANPGWKVKQLCEHFGVSVPTIRKALELAAEQGTDSAKNSPSPRGGESRATA